MDAKKLVARLSRLTDSVEALEKAVAYAFISVNSYDTNKSAFLTKYFGDLDYAVAKKATSIITETDVSLSIYALVEVFELLLPKDIKKENGMVYTPTEIKDYIIGKVLQTDNIPTVCDPACGCGSFLLSAAEFIKRVHGISYSEIFSKYIFGVDIVEHNIEKCKVLFNLLVVASNETIESVLNLKVGSSLSLDWGNEFNLYPEDGFDAIIGNPPYVRSRNVTSEVRNEMSSWQTAKTGNADLYIPFYELGVEFLSARGKLGYISPNTFIQSVNGRSLRRYLLENGFAISILDFRETQVFKNVTSYTCITIVDKSCHDGSIRYALLNGKRSLSDYSFTEYKKGCFNGYDPWRMSEKEIDSIIKKIENVGVKLDSYKIRNGLATLKNDVYFFMPTCEDELYFYRQNNGITYPIERCGVDVVLDKWNLKEGHDKYAFMEQAVNNPEVTHSIKSPQCEQSVFHPQPQYFLY
ncbi:MAG: N-6 DNA methylase [Lachnospiraceae bacterium]|nr:N-6 DNA methylase [Lachnospiraceae bacterium]